MKPETSKLWLASVFVLVMASAIAIVAWVTPNGIGVSPDSITYIETADSLFAGKGFFTNGKPLTHYPPVYPVILALSSFFSRDITSAARWLHALLYGGNALLFGYCIYTATRRNRWAMVASIVLFFSSSAILSVHARAWSESPFLLFALLSYLSLHSFFQRGKWSFLALSALATGLAITTRYVGIALVLPAVLCLILCSKRAARRKFKEIVVFLFIASLPALAWVIRNLLITQALTDRGFVYHPFSARSIVELVDTLHLFILPHFTEGWLNAAELAILLALLLIMLISIFRTPQSTCRAEPACLFNLAYGYFAAVAYLLVVLFTIAFIDAGTPLDERILFPVFLFLTLSVFSTVESYSRCKSSRSAWLIFLVCVAFSIRFNLTPLMETAAKLHATGKGFNSVMWNQSPALALLRSYPADTRIYSNGDDVIRYKTGLPAKAVPAKYSSMTTEPNQNYQGELDSMCADLKSGEALLVYLTEIYRDYYPAREEVLAACNVPLLHKAKDGYIYGIREP